MPLLLARHGQAVPASPYLADADRYLTGFGRSQLRRVASALAAHGFAVDAVFTSPLPRAVQTAELFAAGLAFDGTVETVPGLRPGGRAGVLAPLFADQLGTALIVGHMPTLSDLGAELTGRPGFPPFKPGAVAILDGTTPRGKLDPDRLEIEALLLA